MVRDSWSILGKLSGTKEEKEKIKLYVADFEKWNKKVAKLREEVARATEDGNVDNIAKAQADLEATIKKRFEARDKLWGAQGELENAIIRALISKESIS